MVGIWGRGIRNSFHHGARIPQAARPCLHNLGYMSWGSTGFLLRLLDLSGTDTWVAPVMKTNLGCALASIGLLASSWIPAVATRSIEVKRAAEAIDYNAVSPHYLPMRRVEGGSPPTDRSSLTASLRRFGDPETGLPLTSLPKAKIRNMKDVYFVVDIEIGGQTIPLHVDTGSSDTWLVADSFRCVDKYQRIVAVGRTLGTGRPDRHRC